MTSKQDYHERVGFCVKCDHRMVLDLVVWRIRRHSALKGTVSRDFCAANAIQKDCECGRLASREHARPSHQVI